MATSIKPDQPRNENPEWTQADFVRSVPVTGLPASLQGKLKVSRGPQKSPTKVAISIRLSRDVVEALRSSGEGWQSRVDVALRSWLKRRSKAAARNRA